MRLSLYRCVSVKLYSSFGGDSEKESKFRWGGYFRTRELKQCLEVQYMGKEELAD